MRKYLFLFITLVLITTPISSVQAWPPSGLVNSLDVVKTNDEYPTGIMPNNASGSRFYEWQSENLQWVLGAAMFTNRDLVGCDFPLEYGGLLSSGLLPVIFHNRYTGEPIKSIEDYTPGDIYYDVDLSTSTIIFCRYQGTQDQVFAPEITEGEWLSYLGSPMDSITDGKTIRTETVLDPTAFNNNVPASDFREYFKFPQNDDARIKVFIVYNFTNDLMYQLGEFVDQVPGSVDDYISMIGEKNLISWTNPYTGEPMEQVEWYNVPLYFGNDPVVDPIPDITPDPNGVSSPIPEDIIGNYAYTFGYSPVVENELRAYAQFYFRQPDGSIAAYIAIGVGPQEHREGALKLY